MQPLPGILRPDPNPAPNPDATVRIVRPAWLTKLSAESNPVSEPPPKASAALTVPTVPTVPPVVPASPRASVAPTPATNSPTQIDLIPRGPSSALGGDMGARTSAMDKSSPLLQRAPAARVLPKPTVSVPPPSPAPEPRLPQSSPLTAQQAPPTSAPPATPTETPKPPPSQPLVAAPPYVTPRPSAATPTAPDTAVLSGLSKRYSDAVVFENISMRVRRGEFVAVIGESGVGKSTLLNCMAGLDTWDTGTVVLGGQDLSRLDATRRALLRRTHVGFVFQAFHVLPHLDVAQNIALPLMLLRDAQHLSAQAAAQTSTETGALNAARLGASMSTLDTPTGGFWRRLFGGDAAKQGSGKWGKDERVRAMLAAVGLEGLGGRLPQQLSGGQLQRVAIARALIHRPSLVLADEPTGNLDPDTAARVMDVLCGQAREHGTSVVLVTHSQASAARADRRYKLRRDGMDEQVN